MGCYMSTPDSRVYVTEGKGENFVYATASCQGWRREQEDAEDCLPYFDDNASLFILCDGHGGAEVAKFTVAHLPEFIKNHPLYKEGKYQKALEQAFIDFDVSLRSPEIMSELHKMAFDVDEDKLSNCSEEKEKNPGENKKVVELDADKMNDPECEDNIYLPTRPGAPFPKAGCSTTKNGIKSVVEDVDTDTLRREAQIPIKDLLGEYSAIVGVDPAKRHNLLTTFNASPVVRPRQNNDNDDDNEADKKVKCDSNDETVASSSTEVVEERPGPSSSEPKDDDPSQGQSTLIGPETIRESLTRAIQLYFPSEDSSDDSDYDGEDSSNDEDGDDEDDDEAGDSLSKKLRRKKHKRHAEAATLSSSDDDDDDDDDEGEDDDDSEEDEEDEEDEQADEEFEGYDPSEWKHVFEQMLPSEAPHPKPAGRTHKPVMDSGCTVVVALVKDGKLYVASAGDSRCIMVMRNGECKPMSFDHKPEDAIERKRIIRAGGRVVEGRVNGGLNLSRALGDFTYKSEELEPIDQMITPCPDVKCADLDPKEVEYIFLACDGIWNSMKNQVVTKFIRKTALTCEGNLVEVCLNLFRNCIAPRTDGDGTGCDNMTCIIVRFDSSTENSTNSDLKTEPKPVDTVTSSQKRSANNDSEDMPTKRRCLRL